MTEWPKNVSVRAERINGTWQVSAALAGESWDHWQGDNLYNALLCSAMSAEIRKQGRPDFRSKNARNEAVKFWNSVRRLKAALEGIT